MVFNTCDVGSHFVYDIRVLLDSGKACENKANLRGEGKTTIIWN